MTNYTEMDRVMDRQRRHGAVIASRDWDARTRCPMRDRDPELWASLTASEQSGYWDAWNRYQREADVPVCEVHGQGALCGVCARKARDERLAALEGAE